MCRQPTSRARSVLLDARVHADKRVLKLGKRARLDLIDETVRERAKIGEYELGKGGEGANQRFKVQTRIMIKNLF